MTNVFATALRSPKVVTENKLIYVVDGFRDHTRRLGETPFSDDLRELRQRLMQGLELRPRFYRKNLTTTPDELLESYGIKHLHLGGQSSDVILYLVEYDGFAVLLEVNDHKHLDANPPGTNLVGNHGPDLATQVVLATPKAAAAKATAARVLRIRALRTPKSK